MDNLPVVVRRDRQTENPGMPFRSGSVSYRRLRVVGDAPAAPDEALFATLAEHPVRLPSVGEPPEIASGFCTGRHVFDGNYSHDACAFGAALLAAMRIDVAKVPSEIRRAYRVMAEDARRGRDGDGVQALSRPLRKEAKEEAEERCRRDLAEGKFRRVSMVPFLWDMPEGLLLAPVNGETPLSELKGLFDAAFGLRIEPRSAGSLARELLAARGRSADLEDALPDALTGRPDDGREGDAAPTRAASRPDIPWAFAAGEPLDFLGNLFLLWLWHASERREGVIETAGPTVAFAIERLLDMECAWGVSGRQSLVDETPTRLPEAKKALQAGKWPRRLGLLVAVHGQEFRCTLHGDRFSVSGWKRIDPDAAPTAEGGPPARSGRSPRETLELQLDAVLTFDRALVALYDAFLRERFDAGWPTRRDAMRSWIVDLGRAPTPRAIVEVAQPQFANGSPLAAAQA